MNSGGVLLSGWLRKSPPEKKLKRSWKKRWFVLKSGRLTGDPNVLEYFKHQASKKSLRVISLDECTQIDCNVPIRPDKDFVFDIVTKSRTYYFIAGSQLEMASWVRCLCDLCGFNHDSGDSISAEQQTFKSVTPIDGGASSDTGNHVYLGNKNNSSPTLHPRPNNTLTSDSKPLLNGNALHSHSNGGQSSSRHNDSENGYMENQQPLLLSNNSDMNNLHFSDPSVGDTNGYLHLSDCKTADLSDFTPNLLDTDKLDERRSSSDSVFTHESEPLSAEPEPDIAPEKLFPQSRFRMGQSQALRSTRLDSMPDAPPPAPPIHLAPHFSVSPIGEHSDPIYLNEEDDVKDAPRRGGRRWQGGLSPINDSDLHQVPLGLQRLHKVDENGRPAMYNSRQYPSQPEYMNTNEGRSDSSSSSHSHLRVSYNSPSPSISSNITKESMSPTFPISPHQPPSHYQMPPVSKTPFNTSHIRQTNNYATSAYEQQNIYSSPKSTPLQQPPKSADAAYYIPPRPPKRTEQFGPMLDVSGLSLDSIYNTPRNCSTSSSSSASSRAYDVINSRIKDDKNSVLSPKHSSIIGTIGDPSAKSSPMYTPPLQRSAISASNSPLATPELKRINLSSVKPNSVSSIESPAVTVTTPHQNSNYDTPHALKQKDQSRQNSSSTDSTSGTTSSGSTDVYDVPRRIQKPSSFAEIRDDDHQSYEQMADQVSLHSPYIAKDIDDTQSYTIMAGATTQPPQSMTFPTQNKRSFDHSPAFAMPPPVHRDLKPGRRSLGSDGGSSQGVPERWAGMPHDSAGSEEALSSHTHKTMTMQSPPGATRLNQLPGRYHPDITPNPNIQYRGDPSTNVPERPPKPYNSNVPPRPPKNHQDNYRPSRPQKTGISMTSSSGDSLKSGNMQHQSHFFNTVPNPPPQDVDKGLQYIEIDASAGSSQPSNTAKSTIKPPVTSEPRVEYIQLDSDKTMALQKTIASREKAN